MKEREINILKLITSPNYVDGVYLKTEMNLSLRTIRYSINYIKEELKKYDCELLYSRREGYYFSKSHEIKVELLIKKFTQDEFSITNSPQRQNYIIGKLIFENKVSINKIIDISFCQRSLILSDVNKINKKLEKYNLQTTIDREYLFCNNLTLEICSSIFLNKITQETYELKDYYNIKFSILFFEIFDQNEFNHWISYFTTTKLAMLDKKNQIQIIWYLYYIFKKKIKDIRILNTYHYDILDMFNQRLSVQDYQVVQKVLTALGYYKKLKIKKTLLEKTQSFFKILNENYKINVDFHSNIFNILLEKITEVEIRKELSINIKLKDTNRIIRLYPYSFSLSQQLLGFIYKNTSFPRDDVAYIAKEMQELIFSSSKSKSLLILYDKNNENIEYCKKWINYQYTKNLKIYELNYMETKKQLDKENNGIKLILNFSNKNLHTKIPNIKMLPFLTIEQINEIDFILKNNLTNAEFLNKFFIQNSFKIYLNKVTIEEIIENASKKMFDNKYIDDWKSLKEQCLKREEVSPTYIGYNTLLIHPIKYFSKKNIVFLTTTKNSLVIDGEKCNIFFVCCFKENIDFEISRFFEYILKIVENEKYRNKLLNAQSEMELIMDLNTIIKML